MSSGTALPCPLVNLGEQILCGIGRDPWLVGATAGEHGQAMRASLLASAIASRLRCARRLEALSIHGHKVRIAMAGHGSRTTWVACTKRVRRYLLPRLEILPSLVRSPVDSCFGTRPSRRRSRVLA